MRLSKSGSRRQLSIDKNCRQRGSDANDSPLLLEREAAAEEADVVIGGEQGNQADGEAAEGLEDAEAIEAWPAEGCWDRFWRSWRDRGVGWWGIRREAGGRHGTAGDGAVREPWLGAPRDKCHHLSHPSWRLAWASAAHQPALSPAGDAEHASAAAQQRSLSGKQRMSGHNGLRIATQPLDGRSGAA